MQTQRITTIEQLPFSLNANHIAATLGISKSKAYELMRSNGFPTLIIGKRMIVPRDRFLSWLDAQFTENP